MLINLHREVVFVFLEAEAAGHPTAPVVKDFSLGSHGLEQLLLGVQTDDRLLVAVPVADHIAIKCGRLVIPL
jgi:hypothetical protein